jgi:hypothetical protein
MRAMYIVHGHNHQLMPLLLHCYYAITVYLAVDQHLLRFLHMGLKNWQLLLKREDALRQTVTLAGMSKH